MKKIYVMAAFLGASSFAFNQVVQKAPSQLTTSTGKAITTHNLATKAAGVPLWSSDFSTVADWTTGNSGNQGTFVIGDASDLQEPTYYRDLLSTTAANGFAFFEGVQFLLGSNVDTQNSWIEMANSVDCSSYGVVTLKFEQEYRAFNSDVTYVEVSLDGGTTWVQSIDINAGIAANDYSPNNTVYQNFNVNNSNDVKFRFRWENLDADPQFGSGYAWQIDDVLISSLADYDLKLMNNFYGSAGVFYSQIPLAQTAPIEGSAVLLNQGLSDLTDVVLNVNETVVGTYTGASNPVDIVAGTSDSIVITNNFTPNAVGDYKLEYSISADNPDDVPSNNVIEPYKFSVGEKIYARDTSTQAEAGVVYRDLAQDNLSSGTLILKYAVAYDIYDNASLTGIDFQFGDDIMEGAQVVGQVIMNPGEANESFLDETEYYTVLANDAGTYKTLVFETPVQLDANNTYYVAIEMFSSTMSLAIAGSAPLGTSILGLADGTWTNLAPTNPTYVIRMNFDPTLSVENNELSNLNVSSNFPNPFANTTTVQFNLKEATDVSYTVVDLTGKVMTEVTEGTTLAGDHEISIDGSSFANGVYYLNITAGESTVTRKMIVNK